MDIKDSNTVWTKHWKFSRFDNWRRLPKIAHIGIVFDWLNMSKTLSERSERFIHVHFWMETIRKTCRVYVAVYQITTKRAENITWLDFPDRLIRKCIDTSKSVWRPDIVGHAHLILSCSKVLLISQTYSYVYMTLRSWITSWVMTRCV